MKQELPIAVGLLAVGGLLWFSQGWGRKQPVSDQPAATISADNLGQTSIFTASERSDRRDDVLAKPANPLLADQSRYRAAADDFNRPIPAIELKSSSLSEPTGPMAASTAFLHAATDPRAVEFLQNVSRQSAESPPFGTLLRFTCQMFDQVVTAEGKYFQMGQGSHRSRLELSFDDAAQSTSFQLCDGRFIYRLQTIAGKQRFEFVDLNRVAEKTGASGAFSPSEWIATGGLASLLQQFRRSFNFGAPKQIDGTEGQTYTVLTGCWNENALSEVLGTNAPAVIPEAAQLRSPNQIRWKNVPPQLPHGIEIIFVDDPLLGKFPKRIRYIRFVADDQQAGLNTKTLMAMDFSQPAPVNSLAENMFVIRSTDIDSIDTTDEYLNQVGAIMAHRQAKQQKLATEPLQ